MTASHVRAICDRCGFEFRLNQLRKEWTGLMTCNGPGTNQCWEPRHPQEFVRGKADRQYVPNARPEPADLHLPPPGSALHFDFENNQGWVATTYQGPVTSMLSGDTPTLSDGLVLSLTSQVHCDLSTFPVVMTGGLYGRLVVDLTAASPESFGMLLFMGNGTNNNQARSIYYAGSAWRWEAESVQADGLSAYEQEETTFVFGVAANFAQLWQNGVAGVADTSCPLPTTNSARLAFGYRYHDNTLHQPCTIKSLTLWEGAPNRQRLETLTYL